MNSLLQKHGCANVFNVPEGLKELMSDISREVLRDQPAQIPRYIANYLSALLITREHGILAGKILGDLCDCKPTLQERLQHLGMTEEQANQCADIIQEHVETFEPIDEGDKLKEKEVLKKLMAIVDLDVNQASGVCKIMQSIYRDYWQRRQSLQNVISSEADQPWQIAAQRTIDIYKKTRPSFEELVRATEVIQAAYRGYHVRRHMIDHLRMKQDIGGSITTALDYAGSREIDLGPKMIDRMGRKGVHGFEWEGQQFGMGQAGQPGMWQPGMGQPGMWQPGMGQPGMWQPGMGQAGQPGMWQPGMGQPGMGQAGQPGMWQPGMGQPGLGQPGMGQPGMGQPGTGQPGMGQPGMGQPAMGPPGMGQPGTYGLDNQQGMGGPFGPGQQPYGPGQQPGMGPSSADESGKGPYGQGQQPGMEQFTSGQTPGQLGLVAPKRPSVEEMDDGITKACQANFESEEESDESRSDGDGTSGSSSTISGEMAAPLYADASALAVMEEVVEDPDTESLEGVDEMVRELTENQDA